MKKIIVAVIIFLLFLSMGIDWPELIYQEEIPEYKYKNLHQFTGYPDSSDLTYIPDHAKGTTNPRSSKYPVKISRKELSKKIIKETERVNALRKK